MGSLQRLAIKRFTRVTKAAVLALQALSNALHASSTPTSRRARPLRQDTVAAISGN